MSRHPLMDDLRLFIGKPMLTSIEEIIRLATVHNFRVNIIDPQFNPSSIDEEPDRINVLSNRHGDICMFTIG